MSAPARGGQGLLWRLAAVARGAATATPSIQQQAPLSHHHRAALATTSAAATPPPAAAAPPAAPRPRRPPPLSFAATHGRHPFAGFARVDLRGSRFRLVDARGQVLGRLAAHVATLLQGKDRPTFDPSSRACGDVCVVVNAQEVALTGRKWERKIYRRHSGRPGGMHEQTAAELWRRDPARLVEKAVAGMLPRSGAGRRDRLRRLRVFSGADHPYGGAAALDIVPSPPPPRTLRDKRQAWDLPEGFEPMNPEAYARRMRGGRGGVPRGAEPAGGGPLPAFDDLLAAGEVEVVRSQGGGGGGAGRGGGGGEAAGAAGGVGK